MGAEPPGLCLFPLFLLLCPKVFLLWSQGIRRVDSALCLSPNTTHSHRAAPHSHWSPAGYLCNLLGPAPSLSCEYRRVSYKRLDNTGDPWTMQKLAADSQRSWKSTYYLTVGPQGLRFCIHKFNQLGITWYMFSKRNSHVHTQRSNRSKFSLLKEKEKRYSHIKRRQFEWQLTF